jgi:hypothetical protein
MLHADTPGAFSTLVRHFFTLAFFQQNAKKVNADVMRRLSKQKRGPWNGFNRREPILSSVILAALKSETHKAQSYNQN